MYDDTKGRLSFYLFRTLTHKPCVCKFLTFVIQIKSLNDTHVSFFHLNAWKIFSLHIKFWADNYFSILMIKFYCLLASVVSDETFTVFSNHCFPICKAPFFFQEYFIIFVLPQLDSNGLNIVFFQFILFKVHWPWICKSEVFTKFHFQPLFL